MAATVTLSINNNQLSAQQIGYSAQDVEKILKDSSNIQEGLKSTLNPQNESQVNGLEFNKPVTFRDSTIFQDITSQTTGTFNTFKTDTLEVRSTSSFCGTITIKDNNGNVTTIKPESITVPSLKVGAQSKTLLPNLEATTLTVANLYIGSKLTLGEGVLPSFNNMTIDNVDTEAISVKNSISVNNNAIILNNGNVIADSAIIRDDISANSATITSATISALAITNTVTSSIINSQNIVNSKEISTPNLIVDDIKALKISLTNETDETIITGYNITVPTINTTQSTVEEKLTTNTAIINTNLTANDIIADSSITSPNAVFTNITIGEAEITPNTITISSINSQVGAFDSATINTIFSDNTTVNSTAILQNAIITNATIGGTTITANTVTASMVDVQSGSINTATINTLTVKNLNITGESNIQSAKEEGIGRRVISSTTELRPEDNNKIIILNNSSNMELTLPDGKSTNYQFELINLTGQTVRIVAEDHNNRFIHNSFISPTSFVLFDYKYNNLKIRNIKVSDSSYYWFIDGEFTVKNNSEEEEEEEENG